MPRYLVTCVLYQTCEVEAENSEEAREKANFDVPEDQWTKPEAEGPFYVDLLEGEPTND